jgi:hypothetical protein
VLTTNESPLTEQTLNVLLRLEQFLAEAGFELRDRDDCDGTRLWRRCIIGEAPLYATVENRWPNEAGEYLPTRLTLRVQWDNTLPMLAIRLDHPALFERLTATLADPEPASADSLVCVPVSVTQVTTPGRPGDPSRSFVTRDDVEMAALFYPPEEGFELRTVPGYELRYAERPTG